MARVFPLSPSLNQKITVGSKEFEWDGNFWKRVKLTESDVTSSANSALTDANSYTDNAIASLVNTAPATLDTLNELAAALGDDPNFATTVTNQIAGKADSSHTHPISDVTDLQTELNNKANISGASFNGQVSVLANSLATPIVRNITISTSTPLGGTVGDVWIQY